MEIATKKKKSNHRNKIRKVKRWGQLILGTITGLVLGLISEPNSLMTNHVQMNATCSILPLNEKLAGSQKPKGLKYNEDPFKIINFNNSHFKTQQESLVFVGVMTAQIYLSTRAVAVYETWGQELPGKIAFFSSENSTIPSTRKDLPLVRLKKVDDSYPPQKKSFMMLLYMWENYGDKFEWFIRADDDVYVRADKLETFLRSIDSRKPLFIGQAGRGNQEEFGLLYLEYNENFCMGGPGIILSRETLKRIAPHIQYCLKNLHTTHEDVELGRCVRKFANISCTWSYDMRTILHHDSKGFEAFTGNLKEKEVNRAITLHPIKQYKHMYRLHNYMQQLKIQELVHNIILIQRDLRKSLALTKDMDIVSRNIKKIMNIFGSNHDSRRILNDIDKVGLEPNLKKFKATNEKEILQWDFIQRLLYSADNFNPRRRIGTAYKEGIDDIINNFMDYINKFSRERGRVMEYKDLLYGYARMDPMHGADYILDLLLKYKKYRGKKMTVPVRRHAYLQRQFASAEVRELPSVGFDVVKEKKSFLKEFMQNRFSAASLFSFAKAKSPPKRKIINFILPLSGRFNTFIRFIRNYEEVCLKRDLWTNLFIIIFKSKNESEIHQTIEYVENLKRQYPKSVLKTIAINEEFARARALEMGANQCPDDEYNIMFFIDVDIIFDETTLERIRLNTIRGKQSYFPIVFSEFDPAIVYDNKDIAESPNHYLINSDTGYWRQFGFGIASMFKKDLKMVGGYNISIKGWGKEDVDVYNKFISFSSNVSIFRSVDHTLIHVFHIVECSDKLDEVQFKMCKGTRKDTYGSVNQLANFLYNNPIAFMKVALSKKNNVIK